MSDLLSNKEIDKYGEFPFTVPHIKGEVMLFPFELGKKIKKQLKLANKYDEGFNYLSHLDDCELTPCTCGLFDFLIEIDTLKEGR